MFKWIEFFRFERTNAEACDYCHGANRTDFFSVGGSGHMTYEALQDQFGAEWDLMATVRDHRFEIQQIVREILIRGDFDLSGNIVIGKASVR